MIGDFQIKVLQGNKFRDFRKQIMGNLKKTKTKRKHYILYFTLLQRKKIKETVSCMVGADAE